MLSRDDNELLVRVGPGTAMGRLMRLYWLPFLRAGDVQRDGTPHRVRLLVSRRASTKVPGRTRLIAPERTNRLKVTRERRWSRAPSCI